MTDRSTRQRRPKLPCRDCTVDTASDATGEYYMVLDDVWAQSDIVPTGILCVGCLERRIGRRLTPADFTEAPVNWFLAMFPKSDRLLDRMGAFNWTEVPTFTVGGA